MVLDFTSTIEMELYSHLLTNVILLNIFFKDSPNLPYTRIS